MMYPPSSRTILLLALLALALTLQPRIASAQAKTDVDKKEVASQPLQVQITFDAKITDRPFTGRVYVVASRTQSMQTSPPRISWFGPAPFFAQDVKGWAAGKPLSFGPGLLSYPPPAKPANSIELPPGKYFLQAVMDLDQGSASCFSSPGNGFSKAVAVTIPQEKNEPIALQIDQVAGARVFKEKDRVKLVDIESKLLSKFHGKPIHLCRRGAAQIVRREA